MPRPFSLRFSRLPLLLLLGSYRTTNGVLVNRTIDDEYGDSVTGVKPVYGPTGSDPNRDDWKQGLGCVTPCVFKPYTVIDVSQAVNGTWHDSTYRTEYGDAHTITAAFEGTAIYVYFIVPNTVKVPTPTLVNLTFTIDGDFRGQFVHSPDSSLTIMYHVLVFHATNLTSAIHTIQVSASGDNSSVLLFDNMVYTAEEADPTQNTSSTALASTAGTTTVGASVSPGPSAFSSASSSTSASIPVTAIVGGFVGGVVALVLLVVLLCFYIRRRPAVQHTGHTRLQHWMGVFRCRRRQHATRSETPITSGVVHPYPAMHTPPLPTTESSAWRVASLTPSLPASPLPTRSLPAPSIVQDSESEGAEEKAQVRHDVAMLPHDTPPSVYGSTSGSRTGESTQAGSTLRDQVAVLQEEVARLRNVELEMRQLILEAPPRYVDEN